MQPVWIVSAVRTPIGRFGGVLKDLSPVDLAARVQKAALERAGVSGDALDLFIFGHVLRGGHGQLVPRQAAFQAGIPQSVDGYALDMVCSSGMQAVANAALTIRAGEADLVLAGGTESMSQTGFFLSHRARWGYRYLAGAPEQLQDILQRDGLADPFTGEAMGVQTEQLAQHHGVSRQELDEVALASNLRAHQATQSGAFAAEILPIELKSRKGVQLVSQDEGIRPETTAESLAALRPAFTADGVLTAANSSQISDGASALLLASSAAVEKYGLRPVARILGSSIVAGEPWRFPEAPVPAVQKLLGKLGMQTTDFDLFENNEAFAINSVLMHRLLGIDPARLNVHGGAIALGHPIGASGARIITTLIHALHQHDHQRGIAAICHGTGGATAMAVERV